MAIKSLGRWASSSSKKARVAPARHLMHLRLIPRDDIPGFTGSAIEQVHEINNDWLIGSDSREAVQVPPVYEQAAKTHLDEGCSPRDMVYLSFDRSAWLATTIQSICYDCKNKVISVVSQQAEIKDDYEAEMPEKYSNRLLQLSERLRATKSTARDGILKEIKSYLIDIYSIYLIPLLKSRPRAPKTYLAWAFETRKRETLDAAISNSKSLALRLQRNFLDPELSEWCNMILDQDAVEIRDEVLYSDDINAEDEVDVASVSSDSATDVFFDSVSGESESEGEESEESAPLQDQQAKEKTVAGAEEASNPAPVKNVLLCPPELRKRGLKLDDVEWNIVDHALLGVVNQLNNYERVQVAIAAEKQAEEAYHAAYRKHKSETVSPKKKRKKTQDSEEKEKPSSSSLHVRLARKKHNTGPRQTRSQIRASLGLPEKRPDYTIPSLDKKTVNGKASKKRAVPGRPTQRDVLQEIVQTSTEITDAGGPTRGALTPVSPSARSPSPVKPGPSRGIYIPSGVIYTSSIESTRVKPSLPSRSAMSTTADNDEEDDVEDGWQVKVVPSRNNNAKRPQLKRSPSSRDLSPTKQYTLVEDVGSGFDDDDSDSELEEDAEGELEDEFEEIMLGGPGCSLESNSGKTTTQAMAESDSSDEDEDEVQDDTIVQKMLIPVPPLPDSEFDQVRLQLDEIENMEFLRGLVVPFDYGKTDKAQHDLVDQSGIEQVAMAQHARNSTVLSKDAEAMSDGVEALKLGGTAKELLESVQSNFVQSSDKQQGKEEPAAEPSVYRTSGLSAAVSAFQAKSSSYPSLTRRYGSNQRSYGSSGSTHGSLKFTSLSKGKDENALISTNDFLKDMYGRGRQRSPSPPLVEYDKPVPLRSPPRKRQKIC